MEVKTERVCDDFEQIFLPEIKTEPEDADTELPEPFWQPHDIVDVRVKEEDPEEIADCPTLTPALSNLQAPGVSIMKVERQQAKKGEGYLCNICLRRFTTMSHFNSHLIKEGQTFCKFCPATFKGVENLQCHVGSEHGPNYPHCKQCKEYFFNESELREHKVECKRCRYIVSSVIKEHKCFTCHERFPNEKSLKIHFSEGHILSEVVKKTQIDLTQKLANKSFKKTGLYEEVMKKFNKYKDFIFVVFCLNCLKDFNLKEYLGTHLVKCSKISKFICPFCTAIKYSIKDDIIHHIYKHLQQDCPLPTCVACHKTFINDVNWSMHTANFHPNSVLNKKQIEVPANTTINHEIVVPASQLNSAQFSQIIHVNQDQKNTPSSASTASHLKPKHEQIIQKNITSSVSTASHLKQKHEQIIQKNITSSVSTASHLKRKHDQSLLLLCQSSNKSRRVYQKIVKKIPNCKSPCVNESKIESSPSLKVEITETCYNCKLCNTLIPKPQYVDHISSHCYKCPYCSQLFYTGDALLIHLEYNTSDTTEYKYLITDPEILNIVNKTPSPLKNRKRSVYDSIPPPIKLNDNTCAVCHLQFKFQCHLSRHQVSMLHDSEILQCNICNCKFGTEIMFKYHSCKKKDKAIKCQQCEFVCKNADEILNHLNVVHEIDCSKIESNETKLHASKHHLDIYYTCNICDLKFNTSVQFENHRLKEHGINLNKCVSCMARFSKKQYLNQHMLTRH